MLFRSVHALDARFRLPLSKLGVDLCSHMGVNPGQLHPNTWRYITAHVLRSQELGRPVTFEDFAAVHASSSAPSEHGLYMIKSAVKGKWRHLDSIADWRRKWLLVRPPVGVLFPVSLGGGRKLTAPQQPQSRNEGVKALFTSLVDGAKAVPSNAEFDGPLLEQLGLSLSHFLLRKLSPLVSLLRFSFFVSEL